MGKPPTDKPEEMKSVMVPSASFANTSTQSAIIQSKYIITPTVNDIGQGTTKKSSHSLTETVMTKHVPTEHKRREKCK